MGWRGVYPGLFCEECESGVESVCCEGGDFKSAQVVWNEWFAEALLARKCGKNAQAVRNEAIGELAGTRDSNGRGDFTDECSTAGGTCQ